jgi:hypothetical protein
MLSLRNKTTHSASFGDKIKKAATFNQGYMTTELVSALN